MQGVIDWQTVLLALIAAAFAALPACIVAYRNGSLAREDAREAKQAAVEVKATLVDTTGATTQKLEDIGQGQAVIHELVNSRLTLALQQLTEALQHGKELERLLYDATGQVPKRVIVDAPPQPPAGPLPAAPEEPASGPPAAI